MGPKKKGGGGQQAAVTKAKNKLIEDKTFGMKNKNKSKRVQQKISHMTAASRHEAKMAAEEKARRKYEKEQANKEKAAMAALFSSTTVQTKAPAGVNPKSLVCEFFKKGLCKKGARCKFSHDLATARKSEKRDLYQDTRQNDTMEDWDDAKLKEVVEKKHGKGIPTSTDIVCKHFLAAVESKKYGWFWECPGGGDQCKYRHALPPGYVLKSEAKKGDDGPVMTIEEIIESERAKLGEGTPVTLETFKAWKEKKRLRKEAEVKAKEEKAKKDKAKKPDSRMTGMSGRALFTFNPDIFVDDDLAAADYTREEEPEVVVKDHNEPDTAGAAAGVENLKVDEKLFDAGDLEGLDDLPDDLDS